jgi:hypothetical protein
MDAAGNIYKRITDETYFNTGKVLFCKTKTYPEE